MSFEFPAEEVAAAAFVDVSSEGDRSILKHVVSAGAPTKAKPGDSVAVNYIGRCQSREFDRNHGGYPFVFTLGEATVINGWEVGVATMTEGETALFIISSQHAYGETGDGQDIPPGATLEFFVELASIKNIAVVASSKDSDMDRLIELRKTRDAAAKKRKDEKEMRLKEKKEILEAKSLKKAANAKKSNRGKKSKK